MKKKINLFIIMISIFDISSCSGTNNASFFDVTKHGIDDISFAYYNCSKYISSQFEFPKEDYEFLDIDYKTTDINIDTLIFSNDDSNYQLWVQVKFINENNYANFYVVGDYIYIYSNEVNYISTNKAEIESLSFFVGTQDPSNEKFTIEKWKISSCLERADLVNSFTNTYDIREMNKNEVEYYLSTPDLINTSESSFSKYEYIYYLSEYVNDEENRDRLSIVFDENYDVSYYNTYPKDYDGSILA